MRRLRRVCAWQQLLDVLSVVEDDMARAHPLEVFSMDDLGYASKGHHDPETFLAGVADIARGEGLQPDEYDFSADEVRHMWWRNRPRGRGSFDVEYVACDGPGPGAFPATVVYI